MFGSTDIRYRDKNNNHPETINATVFSNKPKHEQSSQNKSETRSLTNKSSSYKSSNVKINQKIPKISRSPSSEFSKARDHITKQGYILSSVEKCTENDASKAQLNDMILLKYDNKYKKSQALLKFKHSNDNYIPNQYFKPGEPVTFYAQWLLDEFPDMPDLNQVLVTQHIFPDLGFLNKLPDNFLLTGTVLEVKDSEIYVGTKPHWQYSYFTKASQKNTKTKNDHIIPRTYTKNDHIIIQKLFSIKACAINIEIKRQQRSLQWLREIHLQLETGNRPRNYRRSRVPNTAPGGLNLLKILNENPILGNTERINFKSYHNDPDFRFCVGASLFSSKKVKSWSLNKSQCDAIAHCLEPSENYPVSVIHGAPGTGKTKTLAAFIFISVMKGKRLLITAQSNNAVDKILLEVESLWKNICAELSKEIDDCDLDVQKFRENFSLDDNNNSESLVSEYFSEDFSEEVSRCSGKNSILEYSSNEQLIEGSDERSSVPSTRYSHNDEKAKFKVFKANFIQKMLRQGVPVSPKGRTTKLPFFRIGNNLRFDDTGSKYSITEHLNAKHPEVAEKYFNLEELTMKPIEPGLRPKKHISPEIRQKQRLEKEQIETEVIDPMRKVANLITE